MSAVPDVFWPAIKNRESARKAVGPAAIAALLIALLTAVLVVTSFGLPKNALTLRPSALITAAMFAAVAYGLHYRISRTAAVAGLILVFCNVAWVSEGSTSSWPFILVSLFFVAAIRATFIFQKLARGQRDDRDASA